ncbi:MAG: hypothetical protein HYX72_05320 [Acidobacteria bacterium]|nr:hypothetical protein [Acidobacteriota bacterium]
MDEKQEFTLEFQGQSSSSGQTIEVQINYVLTGQNVNSSFPVSDQRKSYQWNIRAPTGENALTLAFAPGKANSPVTVGQIILYPWIDTGGLHTVDGQPRTAMRDAFRNFNLVNGRNK